MVSSAVGAALIAFGLACAGGCVRHSSMRNTLEQDHVAVTPVVSAASIRPSANPVYAGEPSVVSAEPAR